VGVGRQLPNAHRFREIVGVVADVNQQGLDIFDQRTREIGLRMALGAQKTTVLCLIIGEGVLLAFSGVTLGVLASLGLTRAMSRVLFGVTQQMFRHLSALQAYWSRLRLSPVSCLLCVPQTLIR
jgi:ABC-type lipoprotein release transport system permease subunit